MSFEIHFWYTHIQISNFLFVKKSLVSRPFATRKKINFINSIFSFFQLCWGKICFNYWNMNIIWWFWYCCFAINLWNSSWWFMSRDSTERTKISFNLNKFFFKNSNSSGKIVAWDWLCFVTVFFIFLGYIDVGDGCWWQITMLVIALILWWPIFP